MESENGFDEFWSIYPRRVAKLAALKAYKRALKETSAATINQGAARYARERFGKDPQYTAHPATWLNAGRWWDEVETNGHKSQSLRDAGDRLIDRAAEFSISADHDRRPDKPH